MSDNFIKLAKCEHCCGTGQPNGVMGGPNLGLCSYCGGSGHVPTPDPSDIDGPAGEAKDAALMHVHNFIASTPWEDRYMEEVSALDHIVLTAIGPSSDKTFTGWTNPAPDASPVRSPTDSITMEIGPAGEALRILERCKRGVDAVHDVHVLTTTEAQTIAARLAAIQQERDMKAAVVECYSEEQAIVRAQLKASAALTSSLQRQFDELREDYLRIQTTMVAEHDRASSLQRRVEELTGALRTVRGAISYPVSTDINPKGWAWHVATDGQDFVMETIDAALTPPEQGGTPS